MLNHLLWVLGSTSDSDTWKLVLYVRGGGGGGGGGDCCCVLYRWEGKYWGVEVKEEESGVVIEGAVWGVVMGWCGGDGMVVMGGWW